MASHYNVQFASANYNAPYHYPAPRPDHKLELQLQTSIWERGVNMMAAHQKQAGGQTKAPAARAGTLEVIRSWGAAERRADDVMFKCSASSLLSVALRAP